MAYRLEIHCEQCTAIQHQSCRLCNNRKDHKLSKHVRCAFAFASGRQLAARFCTLVQKQARTNRHLLMRVVHHAGLCQLLAHRLTQQHRSGLRIGAESAAEAIEASGEESHSEMQCSQIAKPCNASLSKQTKQLPPTALPCRPVPCLPIPSAVVAVCCLDHHLYSLRELRKTIVAGELTSWTTSISVTTLLLTCIC